MTSSRSGCSRGLTGSHRTSAPNAGVVALPSSEFTSCCDGLPVKGFLKLHLTVLGERRTQNCPPVPAERFDHPVPCHVLHHDEQRGPAGLEHTSNPVLEPRVDAGLLRLDHKRTEAGTDC